ncbi:hypothetical protein K2173_019794 [Erythroxylum novogranatense]|uniref:Retrotransposon gag domain-containing protein n=1 Tax=Erythroxylum novogranatense TaxID=1862640 RepID=A0AAV8SMY3_9ROSI|nr:hypothetical protein K2173_019794 [Erythroxylum novogranatense]
MTRKSKHSKSRQQISHNREYDDPDDDYQSNDDELDQKLLNSDDDAPYEEPDSITNQLVNSDDIQETEQRSHSQLPNSYVNVAPLPVFHGLKNECPVTHLSRFVKVCRANNALSSDMMMRIFPVTLENEALLWYDLNVEPYSFLSWEDTKLSFLEAYHKFEVDDQLREDLMMVKQGKDESVRSYFLRLQWILKKWPDNGLSDELLKGIFVDGLTEDFRDWIIPQKPSSLDEALKLAFSFEQIRSVRDVRRRVVACGFCEGPHEEESCKFREKMRDLWRESKKRQQRSSFSELISNGRSELSMERTEKKEVDIDANEEEGALSWKKKKSQCQCGKHQCWKKKLEKSQSSVTTTFNTESEC